MKQGPRDFKRLKIWQRAHEIVLWVYQHASSFPKREMFGLRSQMQRASVSIPSNIAEGCGRGGASELRRFLVMARGSLSELSYQTLLAKELKYLEDSEFLDIEPRLDELSRMIAAYAASLGDN